MLDLDIAGLSEAELKEAVSCYCSQFGVVISVKISGPYEYGEYAIAAVEMATPAEADKVFVAIGDLKFGSTAMIKMMQEDKPIPVSLRNPGITPGRS